MKLSIIIFVTSLLSACSYRIVRYSNYEKPTLSDEEMLSMMVVDTNDFAFELDSNCTDSIQVIVDFYSLKMHNRTMIADTTIHLVVAKESDFLNLSDSVGMRLNHAFTKNRGQNVHLLRHQILVLYEEQWRIIHTSNWEQTYCAVDTESIKYEFVADQFLDPQIDVYDITAEYTIRRLK